MPKKAPRNAFYYFMLDFKEDQRKKGINYGTLADVSKAADPEWRNASPQIRAKYEAKVKHEKERRHIPIPKMTSTGIPLSAIEQQQRSEQENIQNEIEDIKNMVKKQALNKTLMDDYFYLIDVNCYCKSSTKHVIAESTVLRFNLMTGYRDFYHELVNPGDIPIGYASDAKEASLQLGLDMPDDTCNKTNYMQVLANIIDYLKQQQNPSVKTLPPLFTIPEKVLAVQDFIRQLCAKSGEDELLFRVYRLDTLFFHIINTIKTFADEGFPRESLATVQLKKDPFIYNKGLGCDLHEKKDKSIECTTSRTKRWAFTVLDSCCTLVDIYMIAGQHVPPGYDVEAIMKYRAQRRNRAALTLTDFAGASSSCNTTVSESFNELNLNSTGSSIPEQPRKEKRTHEPLRMPQADYSRNICLAPDLPDLDDDFPPLSAQSGRGRGLAAGYGKYYKK